jgi:hypothetical protein
MRVESWGFVVAVVFAALVVVGGAAGCSPKKGGLVFCHLPVIPACAQTFDMGLPASSACPDESCCPLAGPCGGYLVSRTPPGDISLTCVYDAAGQHLLSSTTCGAFCGAPRSCTTTGQAIDADNICSGSILSPRCSIADGGADAADAAAPDGSDSGSDSRCLASPGDVGCAANYGGQIANEPGCNDIGGNQAGTCGPYLVWMSGGGFGSLTCVYDQSGDHLLSGTVCTDYPAYCDHTASCASIGQAIDPAASCDVRALPASCPSDAGADGAT